MKKIQVWILNRRDRLQGYQYDRFNEEASHLGIDLRHIVAEDFELLEGLGTLSGIFYKGVQVSLPDAVITRQTGMTYFSHRLLQYLENRGVFVVNTSEAIENAEDKFKTSQLLSRMQIAIPKTVLLKTDFNELYLTETIGFPIVLKTVLGSKGDGVFLLDSPKNLRETVHELGSQEFLVQEFVEESRGTDLRVFVVGDQAIGCAQRFSSDKEEQFKANVAQGGSAAFKALTPEIESIAIASSQALGLGIAGVDLLFCGAGYVVCEVNSSPSFDGFEQISQVNVPRKILEYILTQI